jgi:hypothetical protein
MTEFALLAPTLDALDTVVKQYEIRSDGCPVDRDRCVRVELKRMPNASLDRPPASGDTVGRDVGGSNVD